MATTNVFLNVPFDDKYQPLYVALVSALTAVGSTPRSVLEIPTHTVRLERLRSIISECSASVHDLSRVERSGKPPVPRFNMPFELGLTLGIHRDSHTWVIFDSEPHRAHRALSNLGGYDPVTHQGKPDGILQAVTNAFGGTKRLAQDDLVALWKALRKAARRIEKARGSLFNRAAFEDLVLAGQSLAAPITIRGVAAQHLGGLR